MSKKLLSVLLAVLVVAMALPIGFVLAEDPTYTINITDSVVINDFPTEADTLLLSPGITSTDGLGWYAAASNADIAYDATSTGVKVTSNGSQATANLRLKSLSFAEANMLSIWVDTTNVTGDDNGKTWLRPVFDYASNKTGAATDVARYFAAGHSIYFLEDGKTEAIKIDIAQNSSVWNARVPFLAGVKGTYFFPEECFTEYDQAVTGYASNNTVTLPEGAWTSFGDDFLVGNSYEWTMSDERNYSYANFKLECLNMPAGESIIIDDLKYVAATVTENVPAGPVENPNVPSVGSEDETVEGANDGKITGVDSTMEYRAEADADYTAITGVEITGLAPGKYYVRYAATSEYLASADAEVVIAAGQPATGGGEGEGGEGEEPVVAPEFDTEVNAEDFSAFELNHNWTAQWGTFCIYSNRPETNVGGDVDQSDVSVADGRFTITPKSSSIDGIRFTTEIYDIGDWKEKYEALSFELDTTGLEDGLTFRAKLVGIMFEGNARKTFGLCGGDMFFVAEDGTVTKVTYDGDDTNYQWDVPAGFKGTVIIPRETVAADDADLYADYDKFAFQFEFLNWAAADNGESVSIDNIKYLYNGMKLGWVGEPSLTDDTITFGENLELNVSVEDDEDTPLTVAWTFDDGDTIYWGTAVYAKNGVTNIKVDVDAFDLVPGVYEMQVAVFANFEWPEGENPSMTDSTNSAYSLYFTVEPAEIADYEIVLDEDSFTYDGTAKKPGVTILVNGEALDASEYEVSYEGNIEIGTALVVITDAEGGNYVVADGTKEFTITPVALGDLTIELGETEYDYDGTAKEPTVVVKDADGNVVDEYEYVVTYTNNVNAGNATVTITDAEGGMYTVETTTATFTINVIANTNTPAANGQGETVEGKADGIITGVDSTMEYRAEGETTYTAITGTEIKNLAPGKYYIRYAATNNYAASADVEVVIAVGQPAPEPDMGVHSYVLAAILLMIAAAGVGIISLKKRAIQ